MTDAPHIGDSKNALTIVAAMVAGIAGVVAANVLLPEGPAAIAVGQILSLVVPTLAGLIAVRKLSQHSKVLGVIKTDVNHHTEMLQERGDLALGRAHAAEQETRELKDAAKSPPEEAQP